MSEMITVTGNVATDPEQRAYRGDDTVTAFRIASTHRRYDAAAGAWVDAYTNYYSVSAFRTLGEHAFAALRKGQRVIVTGRMRVKEWDNGTKRGVTAEIDAEAIGHDLLFGVTTFQRAGSAPAPAAAAPTAAEPVAPIPSEPTASTDAAGWTIPSPLPVTVGAGADTPF